MCDGELTESLCGKKLECLQCGSMFYKRLADAQKPRNWHRHTGQELERYAHEHHPWELYGVLPEDPDDRPYVWDIEED